MYCASGRLQAVRRQLKQMEEMYRSGTDDEGQNEAADTAGEWTDVVSLYVCARY
jgi:hypothetical protein